MNLEHPGFWGWVLLVFLALAAWELFLHVIREIGKAWRNEK